MIIKEILRNKRDYYIKVKKCLIKALITIACRYPEPNRENTVFPNTRKLIDIRDEFRKNLHDSQREHLFEAAFRVLIDEYEHDGFYSFMLDQMYEEMKKRDWQPQKRGFPMHRYWYGELDSDYQFDKPRISFRNIGKVI
uniref:Uncharacterized protein n=1 Tax=viral metagenome TaxID=1070528 RepID=A0A6H1ZUF0_9ZZZZ